MWIGTRHGLNPYNGHTFKVFTPAAGNSISNEVINSITGEADGTIWVATMNFDVAWSFGTSYLFRTGLGIDARYNLGLRDITEANPDVTNRVWQVGLFYQFKH